MTVFESTNLGRLRDDLDQRLIDHQKLCVQEDMKTADIREHRSELDALVVKFLEEAAEETVRRHWLPRRQALGLGASPEKR